MDPSTPAAPTVPPAPTAPRVQPRIVLGLGNPGDEYARTRHNVGFRVVEELARRRAVRFRERDCNSLLAAAPDLLLVLPQTYMNRSGYAARCLVERRQLQPPEFLVVYDEVHLPLGRLRLRTGGSPGGHRGMESILENLRTAEVPRMRLGVGPPEAEVSGEDLADYVLGEFTRAESEAAEALVLRAADACDCWLAEGAQAAMNKFNG